jgi:hypothetical protein
MKEYEIVLTYLNGCAGAAYPLTSFEEAELADPADYIRAKHGKDFPNFTKESPGPGKEIWKFDTGCVSYTYEFNEL